MMGFFLSRVLVLGTNPIGMAFYAACFIEKQGRLLIAFGSLLGMMTVAEPVEITKSALVMGGIYTAARMMEWKRIKMTPTGVAALAAGSTCVLSFVKTFLFPMRISAILLIPLELILVFCLSRVFREGVHYILYGNKGQALDNQEMISLVLLFAAVIYGLPDAIVGGVSVTLLAMNILLLCMAYQYGSGVGAICGAAEGVLLLLAGGENDILGVMCLLGIFAGMFREGKRFGSATAFVLGDICLGLFFAGEGIGIEYFREILIATTVFLLLPGDLLTKVDLTMQNVKEQLFVEQNMQNLLRHKVEEFAEGFRLLSKSLYQAAAGKYTLDRQDMADIFEELSEKVCATCEKRNLCWHKHYYETYRTAFALLGTADAQGSLVAEDLPEEFLSRCIRSGQFIRETNRSLAIAKNSIGWKNRMADARLAVAGQLAEVSDIMNDFALDIRDTRTTERSTEERILAELKRMRILVQDISVTERRGHKKEIYITARARKRSCISTRNVAKGIGNILGQRMRPSEDMRSIMPNNYEIIHFIEDTNFKVLTGMAKTAKEGSDISGDHFSFLELGTGEMVMLLADGMGSGRRAYEESQAVIELLEQMVEVGFKEDSALKLINSVMVLRKGEEQQSFTTMDISIIDLYTGLARFIKNGGVTTFVRHGDAVEAINGESLPVGVLQEVEADQRTRKLYSGDYVVMVSDGILDSLTAYSMKGMEELILSSRAKGPKELADYILKEALDGAGYAPDDMTVLVAGIWEK